MPVSRVLVKVKRLPSGENENPPSLAPPGTTTLRSAPVATVRKVKPVRPPVRCGPLVRGLMRKPASRSIGCDTSAIAGMLVRDIIAITSRAGLTVAVGSGSAIMMSTMLFGGERYPVFWADSEAATVTASAGRMANFTRMAAAPFHRPFVSCRSPVDQRPPIHDGDHLLIRTDLQKKALTVLVDCVRSVVEDPDLCGEQRLRHALEHAVRRVKASGHHRPGGRHEERSEERRVGKECRSRWSP